MLCIPFLSIVIPVYNAEKYLEACFSSIEKQTFQNYEVIIIDDGSKDNSPEICDNYSQRDQRVKVLHVKNGGPSRARNIGFRESRGKYIFCVDNDDVISSYCFFSDIASKLEENEIELLQLGATYISDQTGQVSKVLYRGEMDFKNMSMGEKILNMMKNRRYETSCWTKVISRHFLIEKNLFFDESLLVEDLDWNLRLLQQVSKYDIIPNNDYVHYYRIGSITSPTNPRLIKSCYDQISTIKRGILMYENWEGDSNIRLSVLSFLGYQFFITMGHSSQLSIDERLKIKRELKSIDNIVSYHVEAKQKCLSYIYRIFGYDITMQLVKYYFNNNRNRVK